MSTDDVDPVALCIAEDCNAACYPGGHYCREHARVYLAGNEVGGFDERRGAPVQPATHACPGCAKVARHPGEGYVCGRHPPLEHDVPPPGGEVAKVLAAIDEAVRFLDGDLVSTCQASHCAGVLAVARVAVEQMARDLADLRTAFDAEDSARRTAEYHREELTAECHRLRAALAAAEERFARLAAEGLRNHDALTAKLAAAEERLKLSENERHAALGRAHTALGIAEQRARAAEERARAAEEREAKARPVIEAAQAFERAASAYSTALSEPVMSRGTASLGEKYMNASGELLRRVRALAATPATSGEE